MGNSNTDSVEITKTHSPVANTIVNVSGLQYFTTTITQMAIVKNVVLLFGVHIGNSKLV